MAAKTEKSKVLHYFKACFNVLTTKNNQLQTHLMAMSNVMFFSHIPDNFQGVTEIVSDGLPKPSRVNIVTKENLLSFLGAAKYY